MTSVPSVRVLDVDLFALDIPAAGAIVVEGCASAKRDNKCISATGAHGMVYARKTPSFRAILQSFYINLPDGMPGVWVGRMKGAAGMKRCYGPDFFKHMMMTSAGSGMRHFFCGGNEGVADELKAAVAANFNNHHVVGTYCPPFKPVDAYDYSAIADVINRTQADVVWIGLSSPKQEQFAAHLAKKAKVNFIITVGAAFDFHTGRVKQAPPIMQKLGLEWFFRLLMEPRRLYKRYFEIVPAFIYYNLLEWLKPSRHR